MVRRRFRIKASSKYKVDFGYDLLEALTVTFTHPVRLHNGSISRISSLALLRPLDPLPNPIKPIRCSLRMQVYLMVPPHGAFLLAKLACWFRPSVR